MLSWLHPEVDGCDLQSEKKCQKGAVKYCICANLTEEQIIFFNFGFHLPLACGSTGNSDKKTPQTCGFSILP